MIRIDSVQYSRETVGRLGFFDRRVILAEVVIRAEVTTSEGRLYAEFGIPGSRWTGDPEKAVRDVLRAAGGDTPEAAV